jgi:hypothetical protein
MNGATPVGTLALCAHCKYAIYLAAPVRVELYALNPVTGSRYGESALWEHFRLPVTPHTPAPCPSPLDYYYDDEGYGYEGVDLAELLDSLGPARPRDRVVTPKPEYL